MDYDDARLQQQLDTLMSQFYTPDNVRARAAIDQLRGLPRTEAWSSLQRRLISNDPDTRCTAALAMMLIDAHRALPDAEILLSDEDATVRLYICNLFGDFGDSRLTLTMSRLAANDSSPDVRYSACFFLKKHGDERALTDLRRVMQSDTGVDYEGNPIKQIAKRAITSIVERMSTGT